VSSLYALDADVATRHAAVCDCLAHRYSNAVDRQVRQRTYTTDLTDVQWAMVMPLVPVPAWMVRHGGRPEGHCHREMIDAVLYLVDNGTTHRHRLKS
jgi:hypothetical protein